MLPSRQLDHRLPRPYPDYRARTATGKSSAIPMQRAHRCQRAEAAGALGLGRRRQYSYVPVALNAEASEASQTFSRQSSTLFGISTTVSVRRSGTDRWLRRILDRPDGHAGQNKSRLNQQ